MRLEHLYPNFFLASSEDREAMFAEYRERRQTELDTVVVNIKPKKTRTKKGKQVPVSTDSLDLLKKLGLIS